MKRFTMVLGAAALIAFASCKKEDKEVDITTTTPDTTVIVHEEAPAPEPETETVVTEPAETNGTSVDVNADGIHVDTKSGTSKTTVNMGKDGAGVEVKK
ncbi:MAG TPA: hypothetical protein VGB43_04445 [Flavobacterium sp.]|jgi:Cu/Ag efflux pump CusA